MTGIENPPAHTAADGDNGGGGLVFIAMAGLLIALVATVVVIGPIGLSRDEDNGSAAGAERRWWFDHARSHALGVQDRR